MLFEASRVYARGEPGYDTTGLPSDFQRPDRLFPKISPTNWALGLAGILVAAWAAHKFLGGGK